MRTLAINETLRYNAAINRERYLQPTFQKTRSYILLPLLLSIYFPLSPVLLQLITQLCDLLFLGVSYKCCAPFNTKPFLSLYHLSYALAK